MRQERVFNKLLFCMVAVCLLYTNSSFSASPPYPYDVDNIQQPYPLEPRPDAIDMTLDLAIARPLLLAATAAGAGLFIVTLPFSTVGRNTNQAFTAFVLAPGRATFDRCLGCPLNLVSYNHFDQYPKRRC